MGLLQAEAHPLLPGLHHPRVLQVLPAARGGDLRVGSAGLPADHLPLPRGQQPLPHLRELQCLPQQGGAGQLQRVEPGGGAVGGGGGGRAACGAGHPRREVPPEQQQAQPRHPPPPRLRLQQPQHAHQDHPHRQAGGVHQGEPAQALPPPGLLHSRGARADRPAGLRRVREVQFHEQAGEHLRGDGGAGEGGDGDIEQRHYPAGGVDFDGGVCGGGGAAARGEPEQGQRGELHRQKQQDKQDPGGVPGLRDLHQPRPPHPRLPRQHPPHLIQEFLRRPLRRVRLLLRHQPGLQPLQRRLHRHLHPHLPAPGARPEDPGQQVQAQLQELHQEPGRAGADRHPHHGRLLLPRQHLRHGGLRVRGGGAGGAAAAGAAGEGHRGVGAAEGAHAGPHHPHKPLLPAQPARGGAGQQGQDPEGAAGRRQHHRNRGQGQLPQEAPRGPEQPQPAQHPHQLQQPARAPQRGLRGVAAGEVQRQGDRLDGEQDPGGGAEEAGELAGGAGGREGVAGAVRGRDGGGGHRAVDAEVGEVLHLPLPLLLQRGEQPRGPEAGEFGAGAAEVQRGDPDEQGGEVHKVLDGEGGTAGAGGQRDLPGGEGGEGDDAHHPQLPQDAGGQGAQRGDRPEVHHPLHQLQHDHLPEPQEHPQGHLQAVGLLQVHGLLRLLPVREADLLHQPLQDLPRPHLPLQLRLRLQHPPVQPPLGERGQGLLGDAHPHRGRQVRPARGHHLRGGHQVGADRLLHHQQLRLQEPAAAGQPHRLLPAGVPGGLHGAGGELRERDLLLLQPGLHSAAHRLHDPQAPRHLHRPGHQAVPQRPPRLLAQPPDHPRRRTHLLPHLHHPVRRVRPQRLHLPAAQLHRRRQPLPPLPRRLRKQKRPGGGDLAAGGPQRGHHRARPAPRLRELPVRGNRHQLRHLQPLVLPHHLPPPPRPLHPRPLRRLRRQGDQAHRELEGDRAARVVGEGGERRLQQPVRKFLGGHGQDASQPGQAAALHRGEPPSSRLIHPLLFIHSYIHPSIHTYIHLYHQSAYIPIE